MTVPTRSAAVRQKVNKTLDKAERTLQSGTVLAVLIVLNAVVFLVNIFLNALSTNPASSHGLFNNSISNVSADFPNNITPAGWTFSIWGLIYLLQAAWIIFSLGLLCRRVDDEPAYLNDIVLSPAFFIFFIVGTGFSIGWLFLWTNYMVIAAFVFLAGIALSLVVSASIGAARLALFRDSLIDHGRSSDVRILYVTVVNGVSMYATWGTIATLINLCTVLVYKLHNPLSNEAASIACLGLLSFLAVAYVVLDITALDHYNRWNLAPYLVPIWALIGIAAKNYNPENISSVMGVALMGALGLSFLIKLILSASRARRGMYAYRQMKCKQPQ